MLYVGKVPCFRHFVPGIHGPKPVRDLWTSKIKKSRTGPGPRKISTSRTEPNQDQTNFENPESIRRSVEPCSYGSGWKKLHVSAFRIVRQPAKADCAKSLDYYSDLINHMSENWEVLAQRKYPDSLTFSIYLKSIYFHRVRISQFSDTRF